MNECLAILADLGKPADIDMIARKVFLNVLSAFRDLSYMFPSIDNKSSLTALKSCLNEILISTGMSRTYCDEYFGGGKLSYYYSKRHKEKLNEYAYKRLFNRAVRYQQGVSTPEVNIMEVIASELGITLAELRNGSQQHKYTETRDAVAGFLMYELSFSVLEISSILNISYGRANMAIRRFNNASFQTKEIYNRCLHTLSEIN